VWKKNKKKKNWKEGKKTRRELFALLEIKGKKKIGN